MRNHMIILLICLFPATARGQIKSAVGPEGGPAVSFLHGSKEIRKETNPAAAFTVGFYYHYYITENQVFRTGLMLTQRGGREKDDFLGTVYRLNYLYLDLPFIMRFATKGDTKFFADIGLFVGYMLKASFSSSDIAADYKFTKDAQRYDTGLITGLGISTPAWDNTRFSFEVRNDLGLINVLLDKDAGTPPQKLMTNSTAFLFGLEFTILGSGKNSNKQEQ